VQTENRSKVVATFWETRLRGSREPGPSPEPAPSELLG